MKKMKTYQPLIAIACAFLLSCGGSNRQPTEATQKEESLEFPAELVDFSDYPDNPIFTGTGQPTWDEHIRERGYIQKEDSIYKMWYTGFQTENKTLSLGYATSADGINWDRYPGNPVFDGSWTEDMMVVKADGVYQMFAEGRGDIAHHLSSPDGIRWTDHGSLDIRQVNGGPLSEGPYGTPTVWLENDVWHLFYERNDLGIWLATSKDLQVWTNVQDEPVIEMGPEVYDKYGLAVNQIVKHNGMYYAYYHGTAFEDWHEWSTNVAASKDLVHWTKYEGNPIMGENRSSGILVPDGSKFRLYTMHDKVEVFFPKD
ncbi:glycosylase [uncultured Imperialibacter sp.]|uniref:glycosylase n=1 Tax=uncultured Imperialibacter sp. TaxID=1672639 RepID=UPI0030DAF57D|tara:strand:+ start:1555 stop:2496 length:942 start_codon:yes stop_codon:yes gene_type:complete